MELLLAYLSHNVPGFILLSMRAASFSCVARALVLSQAPGFFIRPSVISHRYSITNITSIVYSIRHISEISTSGTVVVL